MRILIADDERVSRHLLENNLRAWGHDVVSVGDGLEALAALQGEGAPRLAILDWMMPGLDGIEVCRRLRECPATAPTYVILLTTKRDRDDIVSGLKSGANDYLTKPFHNAELQARVQAGVRLIEMHVALVTELSERKRAQEILHANEEKFRSLIENSADAIALFDLNGSILYASPSTPRVLGYTPEELIRVKAMELIHHEDRETILRRVRDAEQQPGTAISVEARAWHKDGSLRWVEGTFTNLLEEPGIRAFVNNYRDITSRKTTEDMLRERDEQLHLSRRLEAVGQLAGGIAHDFNNLLVVINGYADVLLEQMLNEPAREKIEGIKKAGERAASLTHQLLAYSRKQVLQPKTLDLNAVVNNIGTMLERLIGENIQLHLDLNPTLGHVAADPGQIEQVLVNLVLNARDAMPNGGRLVIETRNAELNTEYTSVHPAVKPGHYVQINVSDTGVGMNEETRRRVFEPFFTTKGVGKGTGLGLSTAYGIVKQSGGSIWVYSELGHGTVFKIYLPKTDHAIEDEARTDSTGASGGSETILVVEDEPMVRQLTREILELQGYTVLEALNGKHALEISSELHIDLLLTDVIMPEMGGKELTDHFTVARPGTRVLFMSGYTDDALAHQGVLDDGLALIEKPFSPHSLTRKVREVLDSQAT